MPVAAEQQRRVTSPPPPATPICATHRQPSSASFVFRLVLATMAITHSAKSKASRKKPLAKSGSRSSSASRSLSASSNPPPAPPSGPLQYTKKVAEPLGPDGFVPRPPAGVKLSVDWILLNTTEDDEGQRWMRGTDMKDWRCSLEGSAVPLAPLHALERQRRVRSLIISARKTAVGGTSISRRFTRAARPTTHQRPGRCDRYDARFPHQVRRSPHFCDALC
jgi:hypothetical protein